MAQVVLNVAAALLDRDPANAERLAGENVGGNVHPASRYPPDKTVGGLMMRRVPGHDFVLCPYRGSAALRKLCGGLGERCGHKVEVQVEEKSRTPAFWTFLRDSVGGVPGQKSMWRGPSQWTDPINRHGDRIGIYVGNPDRLWLYVRAGESKASEARFARMRRCSRMILEQMADQKVGDDVEQNAQKGWSVSVQRSWVRDGCGRNAASRAWC